ncbi:MAG: hypothetical protein LAP85_17180 [Acidobacteriia bacterium]|nr:hypothetical protein [Terriglobia bacterium]
MARHVIRVDGGREYLPKEYRGEPRDYYASKIRQLRARQRSGSLQTPRQSLRALEMDLRMDMELAGIRPKLHRLSNKSSNGGDLKRNWVTGKNLPPMRFAPRVGNRHSQTLEHQMAARANVPGGRAQCSLQLRSGWSPAPCVHRGNV